MAGATPATVRERLSDGAPAAARVARAAPARPAGPGPRRAEARGRADQEEQVAARLRVAVTRLNRRLRQESVTGVSPSQEAALATIDRLGRPTLGVLAQAERVQPPTMTRVVATMEAAGLVARVPDAEDRRVSRVELTRAGTATLERIRSLKTAYLATRLARLPAADRSRASALAALLEDLVEER